MAISLAAVCVRVWTPCAGSVRILLVLWGVVARCEMGEELINIGIQLVPSVCNYPDVG